MHDGRLWLRRCLPLSWRGCISRNNVWLACARYCEESAACSAVLRLSSARNGFSYSKVEGQNTIYTVNASRTTEFKEGSRNLLEDVSITVFGKAGTRNDTLSTKACDFISSTGKISFALETFRSILKAAGTLHAECQCHSSGDVRRYVRSTFRRGAHGQARDISLARGGRPRRRRDLRLE